MHLLWGKNKNASKFELESDCDTTFSLKMSELLFAGFVSLLFSFSNLLLYFHLENIFLYTFNLICLLKSHYSFLKASLYIFRELLTVFLEESTHPAMKLSSGVATAAQRRSIKTGRAIMMWKNLTFTSY